MLLERMWNMRLEFEVTYNDNTVQQGSQYATETQPTHVRYLYS